MLTPTALAELRGQLGERLSTSEAELQRHGRDESYHPMTPPDAVVYPESTDEVAHIARTCHAHGVPMIPFGIGSSLEGHIAAIDGGVSIDLSQMNRVLAVRPDDLDATAQAGVTRRQLNGVLEPQGYFFPVDPGADATLGGMAATRASGTTTVRYGSMRDNVLSLVAVLADGRVIRTAGRAAKSSAGYDLTRLLIGSEGTLGIITEAWMRLQDRPKWQVTASLTFDDWAAAVAATRTIAQAGLYPSNCRLLDPAEAFLNAGVAVGGGLLVLAFESADHPVGPWLDRAVEIVAEHGGALTTRRSRETESETTKNSASDASGNWRSAFLRMPYQRDALVRRGVIAETFETACTWDGFDELHAAITEAARKAIERVCGTGVVTCRFTHVYPDGPAPYYGSYAGGRWGSLDAQWDEIKAAVSEAIITTGGTITHHHAVGRDHRPWYDRQRPDPFAVALRAAKSALDPAGILNPGVLVDR
jgi:alkyldihydroxyacetonephosphate synthase